LGGFSLSGLGFEADFVANDIDVRLEFDMVFIDGYGLIDGFSFASVHKDIVEVCVGAELFLCLDFEIIFFDLHKLGIKLLTG
jgi:hypothetical protein